MDKVYGVPLSPFVRKVLLLLEYKGVAYQNEMVMPFDRSPRFLKLSPMGKIPAFQDDYATLSDSTIICQYLEDKYPQKPLYPKDRAEKAHALWFEEYADTQLRDLLGMGYFYEKIVKPKLLGQPTDEARVRHTVEVALPKTLDYLERVVPADGYLFAVGFSIADIAIGSMFLNARYAGYAIPAARWPRCAAYINRVLGHPAYVSRIAQEADLAKALT